MCVCRVSSVSGKGPRRPDLAMMAVNFRASLMLGKGEGGFFHVVQVVQQHGFAKSVSAGYFDISFSES